MNPSSAGPNKKSFRNLLSRTRSQEPPQTPPTTPRHSVFPPHDPFKVHPGESLLGESDFAVKYSVLFPRSSARVHRPIRRHRSRGSAELNDARSKNTSDCFSVCTRDKEERLPHQDWRSDPYHQYAYETRATATTSTASQKATFKTGNSYQVNRGVDATTQTLTTTSSPLITTHANSSSIPSKYLILPSFADPLDRAIGTYNPDKPSAECRAAPPVGILNSPYGMNGCAEPPDASHPSYDTDWDERLFDPVPGAGIYAGELIDPGRTPKDWNVVYICLDWASGEVVVTALPYNRRGMKTGFVDSESESREVKRADIELRRGFGERWARNMEEEALREIKGFCRGD